MLIKRNKYVQKNARYTLYRAGIQSWPVLQTSRFLPVVSFSKSAPSLSVTVPTNDVHICSVPYLSVIACDFIRLSFTLFDVIVSVEQVDGITHHVNGPGRGYNFVK
jgi:hypothetical protein